MSRKNKKTLNLRSDLSDELLKAAQASQFAKIQEQNEIAKRFQGSNISATENGGGGNIQYTHPNGAGVNIEGYANPDAIGADSISAFAPLGGGRLSLDAKRNSGNMGQNYIGAQFTRKF